MVKINILNWYIMNAQCEFGVYLRYFVFSVTQIGEIRKNKNRGRSIAGNRSNSQFLLSSHFFLMFPSQATKNRKMPLPILRLYRNSAQRAIDAQQRLVRRQLINENFFLHLMVLYLFVYADSLFLRNLSAALRCFMENGRG